MKMWRKIGLPLLLLILCALMLPPMLGAEEEAGMAALRLAGICAPCNDDADCDSGNCGTNISDPNDKRCIPAGAVSYECTTDSDDTCFVDAVSGRFDEPGARYRKIDP